MRPTECPRCAPHFSLAIQTEARHIAVREGPSSAQAFVDEKLEPFHSDHERPLTLRDGGDEEG